MTASPHRRRRTTTGPVAVLAPAVGRLAAGPPSATGCASPTHRR